MPTIVACKLPHGLEIPHNGETIQINGANADHNPLMPAVNGFVADSATISAGYGLTTLSGDQEKAFADWCEKATDFVPLLNGSILTFKNEAEARRETSKITTDIATGVEGLDGDKEMKDAAEGTGLVNSGKSTEE